MGGPRLYRGTTVEHTRESAGGFTITEVLLVLAVASVLAVLVSPSLGRLVEAMRLRSATDIVRNQLAAARIRAIANPAVHCGVHFDIDSGRTRVFFDKGDPPDNKYTDDTDEPYGPAVDLPLDIGFELPKTNSIQDNAVVFRGNSSAVRGGSVIVKDGRGRTRTVHVFAGTGRVTVTIP